MTTNVAAYQFVTVTFDLSALDPGEYFLQGYYDGGHAGHVHLAVSDF